MEKITVDLKRLVEEREASHVDDPARDRELHVEVTFEGPIEDLQAAGFPLRPIAPELAGAYLTSAKLRELARRPEVRVVRRPGRSAPILDKSADQIDVHSARAQTILEFGSSSHDIAEGKGVTIGIIDTGVNARSDALKIGANTTIFRLWDQTFKFSGNTPVDHDDNPLSGADLPRDELDAPATPARRPTRLNPQFDYGMEFTDVQINKALTGNKPFPLSLTEITPADNSSHGTAVAAVAVGQSSTHSPKGIAPRATLIFVKTTYKTEHLIHAIQYIIAASREALPNNPIVINCSFGTHAAPHNGNGALALELDRVMAADPRVAIVVGASNERDSNIHAAFSVVRGATYVLPVYVWEPLAHLQFFGSYNANKPVKVFCRVYKSNSLEGSNETSVDSVIPIQSQVRSYDYAFTKHDKSSSDPDHHFFIDLRRATAGATIEPGFWNISFKVDAASAASEAFIHVWRSQPIHSQTATEFLPHIALMMGQRVSPQDSARPTTFPDPLKSKIRRQRPDDWIRGTLSSEATSRRAIVVGAYNAEKPGLPASSFSSQGPDASNLQAGLYVGAAAKPDIAAPGEDIDAPRFSGSWGMTITSGGGDRPPPGVEGVGRFHGTSFSTPHVSGVVALMWAAKPTLTNEQIKTLLYSSAVPPADTRLSTWATVNPGVSAELFGKGTLDALKAIMKTLAQP